MSRTRGARARHGSQCPPPSEFKSGGGQERGRQRSHGGYPVQKYRLDGELEHRHILQYRDCARSRAICGVA